MNAEGLFATASLLLARLYQGLDRFDPALTAGCFHTDATWLRQGKTLQGRNQIAETLAARTMAVHTQHVVSNLAIEMVSDGEARAQFYLTLYLHNFGAIAERPAPSASAQQIGPCECTFTLKDGEWLLSWMALSPPFFKA